MDIMELDREYEYQEQMISVYEQRQRKIKKKFRKMEKYGEPMQLLEFLKTFIPANIIVFLLDSKFISSLSALDLSVYEARFFAIAYLACRLADKSLGIDGVGKRFEKEDLEQLAIDLYNYQEKVKGCYAQMSQFRRKYFEEHNGEDNKVYVRR